MTLSNVIYLDIPLCIDVVCVMLQALSPSLCHVDTEVPSDVQNIRAQNEFQAHRLNTMFSADLHVSPAELLYFRSVVAGCLADSFVTCSGTLHYFPAVPSIYKISFH